MSKEHPTTEEIKQATKLAIKEIDKEFLLRNGKALMAMYYAEKHWRSAKDK